MKYVLLGIVVVFVGAIVLVFVLHEGEPELDVFADIKYLYEHERYEDIKTEYGKMIKDAIVEFSKHEGWWHHEHTVKSDLIIYDKDTGNMHLGNWTINIADMTIESDIVPNLGLGESGCEHYIKGKLEYAKDRFAITKTDEFQAILTETQNQTKKSKILLMRIWRI